jgi:hypothetical protein
MLDDDWCDYGYRHRLCAGGRTFTAGDTATLTTTTAGVFVSWGGDCAGATNPLDVLMNGDKTCIAQFDLIP